MKKEIKIPETAIISCKPLEKFKIIELGDYILEGNCKRTGNCCRGPDMPFPNEDNTQCKHLIIENVNDKKRARCGIWTRRPVSCALFPGNGYPEDEVKHECGYKWVKKGK